jgi:putative redox protein
MEGAPPDFGRWSSALREISAERAVESMAPRDLLLVHGTDDEIVPPLDARVLAGQHGSADLRMIAGAGHHLRHDPRAIAILLGWLDRQRRRHA